MLEARETLWSNKERMKRGGKRMMGGGRKQGDVSLFGDEGEGEIASEGVVDFFKHKGRAVQCSAYLKSAPQLHQLR